MTDELGAMPADQVAVRAACERLQHWMAAKDQIPPDMGENLKVLREYQTANTTAHDDVCLLIRALSARNEARETLQILERLISRGEVIVGPHEAGYRASQIAVLAKDSRHNSYANAYEPTLPLAIQALAAGAWSKSVNYSEREA